MLRFQTLRFARPQRGHRKPNPLRRWEGEQTLKTIQPWEWYMKNKASPLHSIVKHKNENGGKKGE